MPYDAKADIWSLGCIVYELCALRRPFEGESLAAVVHKIVNQSPAPLPDFYSSSLKEFVGHLLDKTPETRPNIHQVLTHPQLEQRREETKERPIEISLKCLKRGY